MDDYWDQIRITEAMLRLHEPTTAQGVIDVLHQYDPHGPGSVGDAFYSGANADHTLSGALAAAGWTVSEYEAHYAYTLTSPDGRERLRYIEGDVYIA
ncbi:hypothetical protein [Micrococcus luteus]|uniref:hypothetical protein n=1 Tax=Micrococcus luteus TaxID=1270 RepID=UPI003828834B